LFSTRRRFELRTSKDCGRIACLIENIKQANAQQHTTEEKGSDIRIVVVVVVVVVSYRLSRHKQNKRIYTMALVEKVTVKLGVKKSGGTWYTRFAR